MRETSEFTVIPALDLKGGAVVHAKGGIRANYAPVASPFGAPGDPVAIARGLLAATLSPALYIADLDAIAGTGNHFELVRGLADALHGTALWIDAGFADVADCAFWLPLGATLVIGSESLATTEDWRAIRDAFDGVVLSLDFAADGQRGPEPLFGDPSLWPERIIVMNLAKVGTGEGPDLERLTTVLSEGPDCAVYAAGGVRNTQDLAAIAAFGACGALIGTALHTGAITQNEIAALLRERRSR